METGQLFTEQEAEILEKIILNRRDVRGNHFLDKEIENDVLDKLLFCIKCTICWLFSTLGICNSERPKIKEQVKQSL